MLRFPQRSPLCPTVRILWCGLAALSLAGCGSGGAVDAAPSLDGLATVTTVRAAHPLSRQVPVNLMTGTLDLEVAHLPGLGTDANYEVWHVVDGQAMSGGVFDVDPEGNVVGPDGIQDSLDLVAHGRSSAIVITIEPSPDPDPGPTEDEVVAGSVDRSGVSSMKMADGHVVADAHDSVLPPEPSAIAILRP